jgi:3-hydroxy-3-methylglutaryl CoA synthase
MQQLLSYGAYVPRHRLDLAEITAILGEGGGRGTRSVAGYDEDATSMGVEAGRRALRGQDRTAIDALVFATAEPPYLDRTNASVIHAALALRSSTLAMDAVGSVRSGIGSLILAAQGAHPVLVVLSDVRKGMPGGADEKTGGDAASALLFGTASSDHPAVADVVATASATDELFDRWRVPGAAASRTWEDRFVEPVVAEFGVRALHDTVKAAGVDVGAIDHLVIAGLHPRAAASLARAAGVEPSKVFDDRSSTLGNSGVAQAGVELADLLDEAGPDKLIALVVLGDGAVCVLLRTAADIESARPATRLRDELAAVRQVPYARYLSWRGFLDREPPRRPDPVPPAGPPSYRSGRYKYAFIGGRCRVCGTVNLPPDRVCVHCASHDSLDEVSMADVIGRVATYTVDHLAFSASPPAVEAVVDFDGGGRLMCELTDASPDELAVGLPVEMSFRRIATSGGIHNYFWKARPLVDASEP